MELTSETLEIANIEYYPCPYLVGTGDMHLVSINSVPYLIFRRYNRIDELAMTVELIYNACVTSWYLVPRKSEIKDYITLNSLYEHTRLTYKELEKCKTMSKSC